MMIQSRESHPVASEKICDSCVSMVQSAEDRMRNNASEPLDWACAGRILPERNVNSFFIVYPVHVMTRKSFGLMTRKLSVTKSQRSAQFPGTFSRRKLSVASANWAQVA